jgi:hypothetical protein
MEDRTDGSILDFGLHARYLRSVCLASLLASAVRWIRGSARSSEAVAREPEAAFERR